VRLEQGGRHGERVVQVGQAAGGKLRAHVQHRLRFFFDSFLRLLHAG
jgi:hypothetical protein